MEKEGRATFSVTEGMQRCMVYTKLHFCHTVVEAQEYEEVERKADSSKEYMPCRLYSVAKGQNFEAFLAHNTKGYIMAIALVVSAQSPIYYHTVYKSC